MPRWCFWLLGSLFGFLFTLATIGSYAALQVAQEAATVFPSRATQPIRPRKGLTRPLTTTCGPGRGR